MAPMVAPKWPGIWRIGSWVTAFAPSRLSEAVRTPLPYSQLSVAGLEAR